MEEKNGQAQYLYISEPGETDNETIVRALKLPVSVTVNINDKGTAVVQLKESDENGKFRFACEFEATPSVKVSENMRLVIDEMEFKAVSYYRLCERQHRYIWRKTMQAYHLQFRISNANRPFYRKNKLYQIIANHSC